MMVKFIRLINFEMNRLIKFLLPATLLMIIFEIIGTFSAVNNYNNWANDLLMEQPDNLNNVIQNLGSFSFHNVTNNGFFNIGILIIVILFIFYSFFTWYRDWLGKNTFAYRLLMLPMNRLSIFFSKAIVFVIAGLFFYGLQYILFLIIPTLVEATITNQFLLDMNIYDYFSENNFFSLLFPNTVTEFLAIYGFAFGALLALFTGIIMERSYNWKGLIFGLLYFVAYFFLYSFISLLPYFFPLSITMPPSPIFIWQQIYIVSTLIISTLLSGYLLNQKIKI